MAEVKKRSAWIRRALMAGALVGAICPILPNRLQAPCYVASKFIAAICGSP